MTFVQRRPNVFDVGPTLYKCYTNVFLFTGVRSHLDGHTQKDEQEVGRRQTGQEAVGHRLHASVPGDGQDHKDVAQHPQHQRHAVHQAGNHQLRHGQVAHRRGVAVVVHVVVVVLPVVVQVVALPVPSTYVHLVLGEVGAQARRVVPADHRWRR